MNERNVEALKLLIDKAKDAESDDYPPCETDWLARCLALMGVLVPSALTLEQILPAVDGWTPSAEEPAMQQAGMAELIVALERIAKGGST